MCYDTEKTQAPGGESDYKLREEMRAAKNMASNLGEGAVGSRPMSSAEILHELFSYHPPTPATLPKFAAINQAAKNFAEVLLQNCPYGNDRGAALGAIRMARMLANAAISLNGLMLY